MNAHSFASHYTRTRDRGLTLTQSWRQRFGEEGDCPEEFELWTCVPFLALTADDLLWALAAAALDRTASHLVLHVHSGASANTRTKVEELEQALQIQGFLPHGIHWQIDNGDNALVFSVFSEGETDRLKLLLNAH